MIYSLHNLELGSEDAYSRVLGPEHREVVKEAFVELYVNNDCPLYKNLPPTGNFDVKEVLKAIYIFS